MGTARAMTTKRVLCKARVCAVPSLYIIALVYVHLSGLSADDAHVETIQFWGY
jgi:hypothetical protein